MKLRITIFFIVLSCLIMAVGAAYGQTAAELKQKIDDSITTVVAPRTIRATNLGERMKEMVDFASQAVAGKADTGVNLQTIINNGGMADSGYIRIINYAGTGQVSGQMRNTDLVLRVEKDFKNDSPATSVIINPKYNITQPSTYQTNGIVVNPVYHIEDATGPKAYSGQFNINVDSTSSGALQYACPLTTGAHFGYPGVRVPIYDGLQIHNPVIYDTCEYCIGLHLNTFGAAPNWLNSTSLLIAPIGYLPDGHWGMFISTYVDEPNYLGDVPTYIGLPTSNPIDSTAMLQTSTIATTGLIRYTSNLASSYTNRTVVDKGYVDSLNYTNALKYILLNNDAGIMMQSDDTISASSALDLVSIGNNKVISGTAGNTNELAIKGIVSQTAGKSSGIRVQRFINATSGVNHPAIIINDAITGGTDSSGGILITQANSVGIDQVQSSTRNNFGGPTYFGNTVRLMGTTLAGSTTDNGSGAKLQITGSMTVSSVPVYSTGGYNDIVWNSTSKRIESTSLYDYTNDTLQDGATWLPGGRMMNFRFVAAGSTITINPTIDGQQITLHQIGIGSVTIQTPSGNIDSPTLTDDHKSHTWIWNGTDLYTVSIN